MNNTNDHGTASWADDIWGGLAAMLVALPSSVAFGILVYTALGPEYAGQGAMAGLLGAAALGIVAPVCGRNGGLISAPCAPAAAGQLPKLLGLPKGTALFPGLISPDLCATAREAEQNVNSAPRTSCFYTRS